MRQRQSQQGIMTAPCAIDRLPPELLCCIVDFIPRPSDLKSLCLTAKSFWEAATPALYHEVVLDVQTPSWPRLQLGRGLLSVANRGLAHVQSLTCKTVSGSIVKDTSRHNDEVQSISVLLTFLPRQHLTHV